MDRVFQIGHNHINARCQRFGLPRLQVMGQAVDVRVAERRHKAVRIRDAANTDSGCIVEKAKGLEVIRALLNIRWDIALPAVNQPITDSI